MICIATHWTRGDRTIRLKGIKLLYITIQCTPDSCTCTCNYEGTARHPLCKVSELPTVNNLAQWLHSLYVPDRQDHFNQVVANAYALQPEQCMPWHRDRSPLLDGGTVMCYLTLGAANLLCVVPPR